MSKWLAAAVALTLTGCNYGASAFHCETDTQCGADGKCEPDNRCSFPDSSCVESGRRYGDLAGGLSSTCVGQTLPGNEAGVDMPAGPDAQACFGTGIVQICLAATPTQPLTISAPKVIDTSNASMCAETVSGATNYCVIAATTISIENKLRATGLKPLVLIASNTITITASGGIDVGSHRGATPELGAGADPAACVEGTPPGASNGTNGGGAGGSFAGKGGNGGNGGDGGTGGTSAALVALTDLHGGCPGQDGKGPGATLTAKGHGGGAVYLIAGTGISVAGAINAAGEGGAGAAGSVAAVGGHAGGGGGGAGGMIGFDALTVTATSLILANGGGGGEGSRGQAGNPGADSTMTAAALGGTGGSGAGGAGGNGSAGATIAGSIGTNGGPGTTTPLDPGGGGGGGGGGAGVVKAPAAANLGTNVSPVPVP